MDDFIGTTYTCLCNTRTIITASTNIVSFLCSGCHTDRCLRCHGEGHFPASCEDYRYWNDIVIASQPKEVKALYDRMKRLSDDINFFGTYRQWKLNHNDATRERHPELKDAENELVAMYHMMRWCYKSCFRKYNVLGEEFLRLVSRVKAEFDNLFIAYPEPVPEVPNFIGVRMHFLVEKDVDGRWVLTGGRVNAAGAVSVLLQFLIDFYPRAYLDASAALLIDVLRGEKAKWDYIMRL